MPETKVALRLGTEGKANVQNDFREVARAGTEAMQQIETATERTAKTGESAAARHVNAWRDQARGAGDAARIGIREMQRLADEANGAAQEVSKAAQRQLEAWKLQAAAAGRAANETRNQSAVNNLLGIRDVDSRASEARRRELEAAFAIEERGLNRTQRVVAQASILNFTQQVAAGTPVLRAFVTQASDIPTILAADEGGIAGGLAKVRGFLTPVTIGIGALTAALGIGAAAWISYSGAVTGFDRLGAGAARTLGLTGEELDRIAVQGAESARITVGAAREILTGYVQAGGIGRDVLQGLIGLTDDFAAATGRDASAAVADLAAAFADPAKGAEDLARRYGLLTQAQVAQVRQLVEANDRFGAQKLLLEQLNPLLDGSAQKLSAAGEGWAVLTTRIDGAWQALGRFTASLIDPSVQQQIDQLEIGRRIASAVGGNVKYFDDQIANLRRQQAASAANRQQTARDAQANIDAQKKADEAEKAAEKRKRERASEARRLAAEAKREREAEIRDRQAFVDRIRGVLADEARAEDQRAADLARRLDAEAAASGRRIAGLNDRAEFAGDGSAAARIELARRAALRDAAADPKLNSRQIAQRAALAVAEEQAAIDADRAQLLAEINAGQRDYADLVALANDLARVGIDISSEQGRAITAQVRAQQQVTAGLQEMQRFGGQLLDTIFDPSNWRNWSSLGRQAINMVTREFLVLAAVNPIKNAIFGSALPGLGSLGGLFGTSRGPSMNFVTTGAIQGFAMGTPWFAGGTALFGENGPELATLPRGTRIDNAAETRRLLQGSAGAPAPVVVNDFRGAVLGTDELMGQIQRMTDQAAVRGAVGGATLARAQLARRAQRRLT